MSDNAAFFRETADRLFAAHVDPALIAAAETGQMPEALFAALSESGILAMLAPESADGIDASITEALEVMRAAGEAAAPGPILETMLATNLAARAGLSPIDGAATILFVENIALPEAGSNLWDNPGRFIDVNWARAVRSILIVGRSASGQTVALLSKGAGWTITPDSDAAGEARDAISAPSIAIESGSLGDASAYDAFLREAAILRGGQSLGAIEWTLRRTVDYAMERKQFGREIGKFQAVQQALAELADHVLAATAITRAAAEAGSLTLVAAARSRLADASDAAISVGHQMHGAIGFSREYPLNLRTRRLMSWREDFGSTTYWRRSLSRQFTGLSLEAFWPAIADSGLQRLA